MKVLKKSLAALALAASLASLCALAGCSEQTFAERTFASGEQAVQSVVVDVADRAVEVVASEDGQAHVAGFESEQEYYDITLEGGVLTVKLVQDKEWTDFIGTKPDAQYRALTIALPAGVASLTVATTNEDVRLEPLACGAVSLSSNGGNLVFESLSAGESISLTAKNGNIEGTIAGGWDDFSIDCTVKKGESSLVSKEGGAKTLTVDCNNGDVRVQFVV